MAEKEKKDESSLNKLKNSYNSLKSKYNLPEFKVLNENFEIEGLSGDETDILLKKIRKQLMEKVFFNIRTLETFLNPSRSQAALKLSLRSLEILTEGVISSRSKRTFKFFRVVSASIIIFRFLPFTLTFSSIFLLCFVAIFYYQV